MPMFEKIWNACICDNSSVRCTSQNLERLERIKKIRYERERERSNFGMPYQGSKSRIVKNLFKYIPKAENFYDLFGGGGAVTDYAIYKNIYKNYIVNELSPLMFKALQMYFNNGFKDENRWISREEFHKLKDSDPYVAICFSFSNNLKVYAYPPETEPIKKSFHYAICFNDYSMLDEYLGEYKVRLKSSDVFSRRLELQRYLTLLWKKHLVLDEIGKCHRLQNLERRQRLLNDDFNIRDDKITKQSTIREKLTNQKMVNNLTILNKSYDDVEIKENSIVYCDIPYLGTDTRGYANEFNREHFCDWCRNQKELTLISEYQMPDDFIKVAQIKLSSKAGGIVNKITNEFLFIPKHQKNLYYEMMYSEDW